MKSFDELRRWFAETAMGPYLEKLFSQQFELLGISAALIALLASLLSIVVARLLWKALEPPSPLPIECRNGEREKF